MFTVFGYDELIFPLLQKFVHLLFGYNELIFLLLQKFVHLLNVLLYFILVVFPHAADIIPCASDEIDVVDDTGSRLIRPTSEVWDRVVVSLWFQEV